MDEGTPTAPLDRLFPIKAERAQRSHDHARAVLLEAGYEHTTIEQEVDRFLAEPLRFELPLFDTLKMMHDSK